MGPFSEIYDLNPAGWGVYCVGFSCNNASQKDRGPKGRRINCLGPFSYVGLLDRMQSDVLG